LNRNSLHVTIEQVGYVRIILLFLNCNFTCDYNKQFSRTLCMNLEEVVYNYTNKQQILETATCIC